MEDEIKIEIYATEDGKEPFTEWLDELTLTEVLYVENRLARIRKGNFGDVKKIERVKGLFELRIHVGPGYRIYFSRKEKKIVLLFCGGLKRDQTKDIKKATRYLQESKKL